MGDLLAPKTPKVSAPAPLPDDATIDAAARRKAAAEQQKRGVASTMLSEAAGQREKLG